MPLKIDLYPAGPGSARLVIGGTSTSPESVSLALQRNDGRYLGLDRLWQVTPHWHPMFTAEPVSEGLRLMLGSDLVDSIVGVGGAPLRVVARIDGLEDSGTLRIRGALIGSGAAAPRSGDRNPRDETTGGIGSAAELGPASATRVDRPTASEHPSSDPAGRAKPRTDPRPARRPWLALAGVLLLAGVAVGAWWFGSLGDAPVPDDAPVGEAPSEAEPVAGEVPGSAAARASTAPETPDPALSGIALASRLLADLPSPAALFDRAEQLEQAGDCPAAYALFSEAANMDADFAARLARRYDPLTHRPGTCITAPDIPYAIVYYSDAAEAGDTRVQRRLGELMAEHEASGPTREAGLAWLRKAAAAGDTDATRALERLSGPQ